MPARWLAALLAISAMSVGVAAPADAAVDDAQRSTYPGFSVQAPSGPGWVRVRSDSRSLVWMRRQRDPAHTFSVAVLTGPMPPGLDGPSAFEAWVRQNKGTSPDPERFVVRLVTVEPARGHDEACVAYQTRSEDRIGGSTTLLDVAGLACRHPDAPERYFDVQYAERRPAGLDADSPRKEGEAFLEGFRFEPPPTDRDWLIAPERARDTVREAA